MSGSLFLIGRAFCRCAAALGILAAAASRIHAQQISGTLSQLSDASRLHRAVVRLFSESGAQLDSAVLTKDGAFSLKAEKPGVYRVGVRAMGYSSIDTLVFVDSVRAVSLHLALTRVSLTKIEVKAPSRCRSAQASSAALGEYLGVLQLISESSRAFTDSAKQIASAKFYGAWRQDSRSRQTVSADSATWEQRLSVWPTAWSAAIVPKSALGLVWRRIVPPTVSNSDINLELACPELVDERGLTGLKVAANNRFDQSQTWQIVYWFNSENALLRAEFIESSASATSEPSCIYVGSRLASCPPVASVNPPRGAVEYSSADGLIFVAVRVEVENAEVRRFVREAFRVRASGARTEQCFGGIGCSAVGVGLVESFELTGELLNLQDPTISSSMDYVVQLRSTKGDPIAGASVRFSNDARIYTSDESGVVHTRVKPDKVLHLSCNSLPLPTRDFRKTQGSSRDFVIVADPARCGRKPGE
jgi:hypothetical protein